MQDIYITVECNWESVSHKIKGHSNMDRYKNVFKSILRFNGFKEDVIEKEIYDKSKTIRANTV